MLIIVGNALYCNIFCLFQKSSQNKKDTSINNKTSASLVSMVLTAAKNPSDRQVNTELSNSCAEESTGELQSMSVVDDAIDNTPDTEFVSCFKKPVKQENNFTELSDEPVDLSAPSGGRLRETTDFNRQCNNVSDCEGTLAESRLSSAFAVVKDAGFQPKTGPLGSECLRTDGREVNNVGHGSVCMESEKREDLVKYISSAKELFEEVMRVVNMFEAASQLSIGDLKEEK